MTDMKFINREILQMLESGLGELACEAAFLNVFDNVPTRLRINCDIFNRSALAEFDDMALERMGITSAFLGKTQLLLPNHPAGFASEPVHDHFDFNFLFTEWNRLENAGNGATRANLRTAARGAHTFCQRLLDRQADTTARVGCAAILLARGDSKTAL